MRFGGVVSVLVREVLVLCCCGVVNGLWCLFSLFQVVRCYNSVIGAFRGVRVCGAPEAGMLYFGAC